MPVLLIEDSRTQAYEIKLTLEDKGFQLKLASSLQEGIALLDTHTQSTDQPNIQLVLLDLNLPDSYGLDTLETLRKAHPEVPVIVMTSTSDVQIALSALQKGAQDYIIKGEFTPDLLERLIRYALERHQINMKLQNLTHTLKQKNFELEKLNALKNQFVGIAAHDLRNPINLILNYSDFLRKSAHDKLNERQQEALKTIHSSSFFMWRLVNDILDLSAIESGELRLHPSPFDFRRSLTQIVEQNRVLAQEKECDIELQMPETLPNAFADETKVHQILNNLLDNAVKFSEPGSSVLVKASTQDEMLLVSVQDHGKGIPPEHLATLFDAFEGSRRGTAGEKGTGLGLAIVHKILDAHNCTISVSSTPDQGTTFSFTLPTKHTHPIKSKTPYIRGPIRKRRRR